MVTSDEIKQRLWAAANELRGSMDASRYKDYMLGLMFYKFLSDKTLNTFAVSAGIRNLSEEEIMNSFEEEWRADEEGLKDHLLKLLGYYVKPEFLYQNWLKAINSGDFSLELVSDSLNNFERTISGKNNNSDFKGLFATSSIDLSDSALGSSLKDRSENIKGLILLFADLDMVSLQKGDILGDAYEYLIGMFAMESGKKVGEFYTPRQVSEVMARIVSKNKNIRSVYDPTVGSRVIIMTTANSKDRIRLSSPLQKNNNMYWCAF